MLFRRKQTEQTQPDAAVDAAAPDMAVEVTPPAEPDPQTETQPEAEAAPPAARTVKLGGACAPALPEGFSVHIVPAKRLVSPRVFGVVCALCVLVIALAAGWPITFAAGPAILGDELGYWGNAAIFAGLDWYEVMGTIPYYGYGYSLLLVPLFWLGLPMAVMYKIALALNVLMLVAAFVLTYLCLRRMFSALPPVGALLIAAATTLYTNTLTQSYTAWSETPLYLMYWVIVYLVLRLLEKPTIPCVVLLALSAGYIYMVHLRSLGVLIALVMTVLLFVAARRLGWKQLLVFVLSFVVILALQNLVKEWTNTNIYTSEKYIGANDYGSQINNMVDTLTTPDGLLALLRSATGKLFYTATATLLFALVSLRLLFADFFGALWGWLKSGFKTLNPRKLPSLFILLSFGGTFMVNAIAMRGGGRMDVPFYGRYMEFAFGPLIAIGMALLVLGRVRAGQMAGCAVVTLVLAFFSNGIMLEEELGGAGDFNFVCITAWKALCEVYPGASGLCYFIAAAALVVFLLMWGAQHAFGSYLEISDTDDRKIRLYKKLRPLLRVLLPVLLASAAWVWAALMPSAQVESQRAVSQGMAPVLSLLDAAGQQPSAVYLVREDEEDYGEAVMSPRQLQLRLPYTSIKVRSLGEYSAMEQDAAALFIASADSPANNWVVENYVCLFVTGDVRVYASADSVWYQAAQTTPLIAAQSEPMQISYELAAAVPANAARLDETAADSENATYIKKSTPIQSRREDGAPQFTLPVGIATNGMEGLVFSTEGLALPAGQYEASIVLTVTANGGGSKLGEFTMQDSEGRVLGRVTARSADFALQTPTRMTLTATTMLDEQITGALFQFTAEAGVQCSIEKITCTRVGQTSEVITADTAEMNQLERLLFYDYENRPLYVLPRPSQQSRASVEDLKTALRGREIAVLASGEYDTLRTAPGIVLVPTSRQSLIYTLLGHYTIAERLGSYTVLLPTGTGTANEFVVHGGTPMSEGYSIDLRYYVTDGAQEAGSVTAVPPAGTYYVTVSIGFDNTLTGNYGSFSVSKDGKLLQAGRIDKGEEEEAASFSPYTLTFDGEESLAVQVSAGQNARLSTLRVLLRSLGDTPATYGDPLG